MNEFKDLFLINAEKWGSHKRWGDINFCKRLRNMRSHKIYGMSLSNLEKKMEMEWHLREKRVEEAEKIHE